MRLGKRVFAACAVAALVVSAGNARSAEPAKLRVGWVVPGADSPFLLYGKKGITKHEGVTYTLDAIHFKGTPPMITAMAAGEIELATFAYSSFALAVENAGMSDLRIIADVFQDGVPGWYTNPDVVLKDGPVKTIEDLKGKVLATNVTGSAVDMAVRAMLTKHHLDLNRDVTFVSVPFPNMKAELLEHKIDFMTAVLPFAYDPKLQEVSRTLFTQKDAIGRSQMIILCAREAFLKNHHAIVVDYLEDELRAQHWFTAPANHDEAVKLVAAFAKQPPARYKGWLFTHGDYYRDPHGMPDLGSLQANVDLQHKLGFLKAPLDVKKYAVLGPVEEAAKRLK
jgi:NitT/TauT family transport system substrate-binding protein